MASDKSAGTAAPGEATALGRGDAVMAWALTPVVEAPFAGTARPMPADIDYRFLNGFVDVGDLPCREAFRATMVGRDIACPDKADFTEMVVADAQGRVDCGGFWHRPTHVRRAARCVLTAPAAGPVRFRLTTCGGARVWVGGREEASFEPFTRNRRQDTDIALHLDAGTNEILVHFEELCERDTDWLFALRLLSDTHLQAVPVAPGARAAAEHALEHLGLDRLVYGDGPVELVATGPLEAPLGVDMRLHALHRDDERALSTRITLSPQTRRRPAFHARDTGHGCAMVELAAGPAGARVRRMVGATFAADLRPSTGTDLAARKRAALAYIAAAGRTDPARALAMLALGTGPAGAERLLGAALARIADREDCSDFAMVSVLWAWRRHAGTQLSAPFWRRARDVILGWRYWLDEPGNDVMWFWSENHALCFHVCQYLAGQFFPGDIFTCSGRTGRGQRALAHTRLMRWFDALERDGLAEWNSAAYYPIDLLGLLALHALADDAGLRRRAGALIDTIFATVALHTLAGVPGGSMGRAYEKELLAGPTLELAGYAGVAWGQGWFSRAGQSLPLFCLSDHAPPSITARFVRPLDGETLEAAHAQGAEGGAEGGAQLRLWKDGAGQLSTATGLRPGAPGHQQHVLDVRLAGSPHARFWINHPGEARPWGHHRPSYWAGNGSLPHIAQHGPVALAIFRAEAADDLPWTHLFAPREACCELVADGGWLFARSGDGYAGFHAARGLAAVEDGPFAGSEWRSAGRRTAWLAAVGSAGRDGGFAGFRARWQDAKITFDASALTLAAGIPGGPDLRLAFGGLLCVDGRPQHPVPAGPVPHVRFGDGHFRPWHACGGPEDG